MTSAYSPGTAPIKQEFLISRVEQSASTSSSYNDDAAEGTKRPNNGGRGDVTVKKQRKGQRGQNKGRRFGKVRDELELCWKTGNGVLCEYGDGCKFTHDIYSYLSAKPPDIHIPTLGQIIGTSAPSQDSLRTSHLHYPSVDVSTTCPIFAESGECRYGFKCRFLGGHIRISDSSASMAEHCTLIHDEDIKARTALTAREMNYVPADVLKQLRSRKYAFPTSDAYLASLGLETTSETVDSQSRGQKERHIAEEPMVIEEPEQRIEDVELDSGPVVSTKEANDVTEHRTGDPTSASTSGESQRHSPDARIRFSEKKRLNWRGKTYLAPLTTVGNLPFRRLCVDLGAEITCGEMALAQTLLSGSKEEWSLLRRHPSEKTFGVQLAGNRPGVLVPTAEVIAKEIGQGGGVDFVDVNCGCPIDLVFKSGSGSALLDAPSKLGKILVGMNHALGEIPLTVKLRTGVKDAKHTAHKLMPRLGAEWEVGCIALHGRSRQQRYTRLANWEYIEQCVEAVRAREKDEDLPPIPIFGNGDIFSYAGYQSTLSSTGVDGIMIGRGALIKPWIFTELKEGREWDISARERLDLVGRYARYGLSHFGSDTTGVNATRRYLCEALSFQYRYVPIGLLEHLPGRINDRAPAFRGRDELETLLTSPDSKDWVRISEMFLGPAPETWSFTPKHKSNAYDSGNVEAQG